MTACSCTIVTATPRDKARWDAYVLGHPRGVAYQLFAYREAVEAAYGFKGIYLMAVQGNSIQGILPLIHVHLPGLKGSLVSLPYCDAGGPLAPNAEIEADLLQHALETARHLGVKTIVMRSMHPFANIPAHLTRHRAKVGMRLPLPARPDQLFSSFKAKVRSQIRKPIKDNLIFEMDGKRSAKAFYTIFSENMRDLGSPVHASGWIKQVLAAFGNRAHVGLVRLPDRTPAAAGIILCHPHMVSIPWASSLRRFNPMNPNMMLYWHLLKFAVTAGYPLFDLGRSTPGQGTFRFKKQWGASPKALHWIKISTAATPQFIPTAPPSTGFSAREYAARGIMQIPLSLATALGSGLRKYITL